VASLLMNERPVAGFSSCSASDDGCDGAAVIIQQGVHVVIVISGN